MVEYQSIHSRLSIALDLWSGDYSFSSTNWCVILGKSPHFSSSLLLNWKEGKT